MIFSISQQVPRAFCAACCSLFLCSALAGANVRNQATAPAQEGAKQSSAQGPPLRIPRQQAQTTAALDGRVRDAGSPESARSVPSAMLTLRNLQSGQLFSGVSSGEGVFRLFPLPPGRYDLRVEAKDYAPFVL